MQRVLDGEPLAYVLGEWDFYGMTLQVNKDVLIPRDDTCAVTDLAIKKALFLILYNFYEKISRSRPIEFAEVNSLPGS